MLESLRNRAELHRKAGEIYGAIVAQARRPAFYAALGVPDTPSGRYEMVTLHLVLVLERLRATGGTSAPLPRLLTEAFVADMDDSLRELGTGDLAVPKKVRRAAAGLYERTMAYRAALEAGDERALANAFIANVFSGAGSPGAAALARYAVAAMASLARADLEKAVAVEQGFPPIPDRAEEAA